MPLPVWFVRREHEQRLVTTSELEHLVACASANAVETLLAGFVCGADDGRVQRAIADANPLARFLASAAIMCESLRDDCAAESDALLVPAVVQRLEAIRGCSVGPRPLVSRRGVERLEALLRCVAADFRSREDGGAT